MGMERSEKIYEAILEQTLAGYWDWHIVLETEYLSRTFKEMLGYTDDEVPNSPDSWKSLIHPEDYQIIVDGFQKHVKSRGKVPFREEVRYLHKEGFIKWVLCVGKVVEWDADHNPIRAVGCHIDITELKEKEQNLLMKDTFIERITDHVPGVIFQLLLKRDGTFEFLYVSKGSAELFGATPEEFYKNGPIIFDFIESTFSRRLKKALVETYVSLTEWDATFQLEIPGSGKKWVKADARPERLNDENVVLFGYIRDITKEREGQIEFRKISEEYERVFHGTDLALALISVNGNDFRYVRCNEVHQEKTGLGQAELAGKAMEEIFGKETGSRVSAELSKCISVNDVVEFQETFDFAAGRQTWQIRLSPIDEAGQIRYVISSGMDITEKLEAEEKLERLTRDYEIVFESTQDAIILIEVRDENTFVYKRCNLSYYYKTGISNSMMAGKTPTQLFGRASGERLESKYKRCIEDGVPVSFEDTLEIARFKQIWLVTLIPVIEDGRPTYIVSSGVDVTIQKMAQENLDRKSRLVDLITVSSSKVIRSEQFGFGDAVREILAEIGAFTGVERSYIYELSEDGSCAICRYEWNSGQTSPQKQEGKTLALDKIPAWISKMRAGENIIIHDVDELDEGWSVDGKALAETGVASVASVPVIFENRLIAFIGFEVFSKKVKWLDDDIRLIRVLADNISASYVRRNAMQQLQNSLDEKNMLLAEIHHRVKNNLAIISSLLMLQLESIGSLDMRNILISSNSRIRSIAMVHEMLYESESFSSISFKGILARLMNHVSATFGNGEMDVKTNLKADNVILNIQTAIPCTLIVNEILVNAYKHAFMDRKKGEVNVIMTADKDQILIDISDNGIGMPEGFDILDNNSLGFTLINGLLDQVNGSIEMESEPGKGTNYHLKILRV